MQRAFDHLRVLVTTTTLSADEMAARLGVSVPTVRAWCAEMGLEAPRVYRAWGPRDEEARAALVQLVRDGASYHQAALAGGVAVATVRRWCLSCGVASRAKMGRPARRGAA